jgi:predicted ribosomally synthesized peptide with nif11-like leader
MSIENAIGFVKLLGEDSSAHIWSASMDREQMLAFAKERGFDFTIVELEDVCEYADSQGEEIDIEVLEKVVGGCAPSMLGGGLGPVGLYATVPIGAKLYQGQGKSQGWW